MVRFLNWGLAGHLPQLIWTMSLNLASLTLIYLVVSMCICIFWYYDCKNCIFHRYVQHIPKYVKYKSGKHCNNITVRDRRRINQSYSPASSLNIYSNIYLYSTKSFTLSCSTKLTKSKWKKLIQ